MRKRDPNSVVIELDQVRSARRALGEISPDTLAAALDEAERGRQLARDAQRRTKRPALRLLLGQRGVVRARGSTWRLQFRGEKDARGKRPQLSVPIGDRRTMSYELAREAADRMMMEIAPRRAAPGSTCTWQAWVDRYELVYLPNLRRGSRRTVGSIIKRHLLPAFRELHLHELRRSRVQTWIATMRARGAAPASIAARYRVLRRMLRCARAEGYSVEVPAAGDVDLPRRDAPTASMLDGANSKAFTREEVARIIAAAGEPWRTLYMLCAFCGLRIGEALGLRWCDVDLSAGELRIVQQARAGEGAATKTAASVATRSIPPRLLAHLREFRGSAGADAQLVFPSPRGGCYDDSGVRRRHLNPLLARLGLRRRGRAFHQFRHYFGSAGARIGVPNATLQRLMRHADLRATQKYVEVPTQEIDRAICAIEAFTLACPAGQMSESCSPPDVLSTPESETGAEGENAS